MERRLEKRVELDASPEQVWEAIATGPGISTWFVPHQVEPGEGGKMSAQFGSGFDETGRVTAWEPGRRFAYGTVPAPPEGAADYAFEFLVEGRDGGGTVLRFVQSGFLDEGWENEYNSFDAGWSLFFGNLQSYFTHFAGLPVHNVVTMGFTPVTADDAWPVLHRALGLAGHPAVGDRVTLVPTVGGSPRVSAAQPHAGRTAGQPEYNPVRGLPDGTPSEDLDPPIPPTNPRRQALAPDGPPPITGVVDVATREFLGVRSATGLHRIGAEGEAGCGVSAYHYLYGDPVDVKELTAAWQRWLVGHFPPAEPGDPVG